MKKESNEKNQAAADRSAAHQLMTQWVKENTEDVACAISQLVPFICGECDTAELDQAMNVVNMVFANVSLDVIKSRNNAQEGKGTALTLPADAWAMQEAIYKLSRFLKMFRAMGDMLHQNEKLPAFRLSLTAYDEVDSI